jgi:hypothetical protein
MIVKTKAKPPELDAESDCVIARVFNLGMNLLMHFASLCGHRFQIQFLLSIVPP